MVFDIILHTLRSHRLIALFCGCASPLESTLKLLRQCSPSDGTCFRIRPRPSAAKPLATKLELHSSPGASPRTSAILLGLWRQCSTSGDTGRFPETVLNLQRHSSSSSGATRPSPAVSTSGASARFSATIGDIPLALATMLHHRSQSSTCGDTPQTPATYLELQQQLRPPAPTVNLQQHFSTSGARAQPPATLLDFRRQSSTSSEIVRPSAAVLDLRSQSSISGGSL